MPEHTLSAFALRAEQAPSRPLYTFPVASEVLPVTMALSIVFHAFLLLITFKPPDVPASKFKPQLDVVLVNTKSASRPTQADALAQANLDGGGNTVVERVAKSNLPVLRSVEASDTVQLAARRVQRLEHETQRLLEVAGRQTVSDAHNTPAPQSAATETVEEPASEAQKLLIAKLEAQIARDWDAYQKLPRRKFIGARTESVVYAEYVDRWRRRIEKIGTENYPDDAKRRSLYGALLVTVSVKADGTVEKIEIERSSGHRVLDQAAVRIVELAGPFPPFPQAIRAQYDILSITRNWAFTRSDLEITVAQ